MCYKISVVRVGELMQKELTITVEEDIYEELNRVVAPADISQFIDR